MNSLGLGKSDADIVVSYPVNRQGVYVKAGDWRADLANVGVNYEDVTSLLETEGVEKFIVSWTELLDSVTAALQAAK